jgi:hypothetical protein
MDQRSELVGWLGRLVEHLRDLESKTTALPYAEAPQPYAWREIIAQAEYLLDPDDGAPTVQALARSLIDLVDALDDAAPEGLWHPARQALERAWAWCQASASPAAPPGQHMLRVLNGWLPIPMATS